MILWNSSPKTATLNRLTEFGETNPGIAKGEIELADDSQD